MAWLKYEKDEKKAKSLTKVARPVIEIRSRWSRKVVASERYGTIRSKDG